MAKRIPSKEKVERQLAGQSAGALLFSEMEEKEPRQKTVMFHDSNVRGAKICLHP